MQPPSANVQFPIAMNSSTLRRRSWFWFCVLVFLPGCATPPKVEVPGTLKVQVYVPPSWNLLLDDRIAEAFTDRVADVFHRSGFGFPIENVRTVEDPAKEPYLLTIRLTDWRITHLGNIDCTFTAQLKTPQSSGNLGVYTNTSMRSLSSGRFGFGQSFEEAAEGAIRDLANDIAKGDLLQGMRRR